MSDDLRNNPRMSREEALAPHILPGNAHRVMRQMRLVRCASAQESYASDAPVTRLFPLSLSCTVLHRLVRLCHLH